MAKKLCRHYQIHHITIKEVIAEKMKRLVSGVKDCRIHPYCHESMEIYHPLVEVFCTFYSFCIQNTLLYTSHVLLQKEMVSGAEFFTEEEKAAAQEQLENCQKSMEANDGQWENAVHLLRLRELNTLWFI